MSRPPPPKRQKAEPRTVLDFLTDYERDLYNVIKSKESMGIWTKHLKDESKVPSSLVPKCLKSLQTKNLIKEVSNVQSKGKKYYMASEFEPSVEITGGIWYKDGELNLEYIHEAREAFLRVLDKHKVATLQKISLEVKKDRRFKEFTEQQTEQVLRDLVIDSRIVEVKSTGTGEFVSVAVGVVCYKCKSKGGKRGEPKVGAMASIPCGVCPRIGHCTPDGIISPATCEYYTKWLEF